MYKSLFLSLSLSYSRTHLYSHTLCLSLSLSLSLYLSLSRPRYGLVPFSNVSTDLLDSNGSITVVCIYLYVSVSLSLSFSPPLLNLHSLEFHQAFMRLHRARNRACHEIAFEDCGTSACAQDIGSREFESAKISKSLSLTLSRPFAFTPVHLSLIHI